MWTPWRSAGACHRWYIYLHILIDEQQLLTWNERQTSEKIANESQASCSRKKNLTMNYQQPRKKKTGKSKQHLQNQFLYWFFFSLLRFLTFTRKKLRKFTSQAVIPFTKIRLFQNLGFHRPKAENREWQKKKEEEENE